MKKPAVFIIDFQNPVQIVHVYEVLRSGSFFSKIAWPFQFNVHFFSLSTAFTRKLMKRPTNFMAYFQTFYHYVHVHEILSSRSFFEKNGGCFNILTIYDSFAQFAATFATKLMKISAIFFTYFETSILFLQVYKVSSLANQ